MLLLYPFAPEATAFQAGRLMLDRIHHLSEKQKDFAFESTMASVSFAPILQRYKKQGYQVHLLFILVRSVELAIQRIKQRVANGGHNIPDEVIRRRYNRCITNLFNIYIPIADAWGICDNSYERPSIIAIKVYNNSAIILDEEAWDELTAKGNYYE